eukprot:1899633-Rhodomonas_salina.1
MTGPQPMVSNCAFLGIACQNEEGCIKRNSSPSNSILDMLELFPSIDASPDISLRFGIQDLNLESDHISSPRPFRAMGEGDSEMQHAASRNTDQGSTRDRNETARDYDKTHKSQRSGSTKNMNTGGG